MPLQYLKVPGAVVASAVLFSMAHFSLSRSLPLVLLGAVIGVLFAASRCARQHETCMHAHALALRRIATPRCTLDAGT